MASRGSPKKSVPTCVYCAKSPGIEGDHVPPEGFFPHSERAAMTVIKVPSCSACNRAQSDAEEEFRDVLAMLQGPASAEVYQKFRRSLTWEPKRRRVVAAISRRGGSLVYSTLKVKYRDMFIKVAKGLYFHEFGPAAPPSYLANAWLDPRDRGDRYRNTPGVVVRKLAPSFTYIYVGSPDVSIWWFDFAGRAMAMATIEKPTLWAQVRRFISQLTGGVFSSGA
jgi:hypothetical protein